MQYLAAIGAIGVILATASVAAEGHERHERMQRPRRTPNAASSTSEVDAEQVKDSRTRLRELLLERVLHLRTTIGRTPQQHTSLSLSTPTSRQPCRQFLTVLRMVQGGSIGGFLLQVRGFNGNRLS